MFKLDNFIELMAELIRILVVDETSELVRKLAGRVGLRRQLRGMSAVRRHIHRRCRRRLFNRISTMR